MMKNYNYDAHLTAAVDDMQQKASPLLPTLPYSTGL